MAFVQATLEFTSVGCNRRHNDLACHRVNHLRLDGGLVENGDFDLWVLRHHHELRFVQIGELFLHIGVAGVPPTLHDAQFADEAIVQGVLQDLEAVVLTVKQIIDELRSLPRGLNVFIRLWRELDHAPVGGERIDQQCLGGLDRVKDVAGDVLAAARLLVAQWLAVVVAVALVALFANQAFGVGVRCVEVALQKRQQFAFFQRCIFDLRH